MLTNRKPPSAANAQTATTVAPLNGALRKNRRSISGSARRRSYHSSPASAATAVAAKPRISGEVQPADGASMIAYVSVPSSAITSSCPTGSTRRGCGARDSGTYRTVRNSASAPMGTLIQKIARQSTLCTSSPPTIGPAAMLMPTTPPHTPIARARSFGSVKVLVMIDIATGLSIEPPTACTMRNATRHSRFGARLHSSEPSAKTTRPAWKTRRRPSRSAVEPASISSDARTRV
ncbi:hypothetical protein DF17_17100 [Streptomyces rimosus]|nr:hypothetical protein DF17_17100 [Streptomyces rimosus]